MSPLPFPRKRESSLIKSRQRRHVVSLDSHFRGSGTAAGDTSDPFPCKFIPVKTGTKSSKTRVCDD